MTPADLAALALVAGILLLALLLLSCTSGSKVFPAARMTPILPARARKQQDTCYESD